MRKAFWIGWFLTFAMPGMLALAYAVAVLCTVR